MSQFLPAFNFTLKFEDSQRSYKNTIDNDGGGVIAGINSKSFPDDYALIATIPQANRGPAIQDFYLNKVWTPTKVGGIVDQALANHVFDSCFNQGQRTGIKILQESINSLHRNCPYPLETDGLLEPDSLEVVNSLDPAKALAIFTQFRISAYRIDASSKTGSEALLHIWTNRALAD
jgi:lysozyme family protein